MILAHRGLHRTAPGAPVLETVRRHPVPLGLILSHRAAEWGATALVTDYPEYAE